MYNIPYKFYLLGNYGRDLLNLVTDTEYKYKVN